MDGRMRLFCVFEEIISEFLTVYGVGLFLKISGRSPPEIVKNIVFFVG